MKLFNVRIVADVEFDKTAPYQTHVEVREEFGKAVMMTATRPLSGDEMDELQNLLRSYLNDWL